MAWLATDPVAACYQKIMKALPALPLLTALAMATIAPAQAADTSIPQPGVAGPTAPARVPATTDIKTLVAVYRGCISVAQSQPDVAITRATGWIAQGGGNLAQHCLGLAQLGSGKFSKAGQAFGEAARLTLAPDPQAPVLLNVPDPQGMAAELFGQSGNAWLLAGEPANAVAMLSSAVDLLGDRPEARGQMLVDRARAYAEQKNYTAARADLLRAVQLLPAAPEAWLFLATAQRHLMDLDGADAAISRAAGLSPAAAAIQLELGAIRILQGREDDARAAWARAIATADGDEDILRQAASNLKALDATVSPPS